MYRLMALSITRLTQNDIPGTLRALTLAAALLRAVLRFFYDNLRDENLSTPLWMAYCQGFHGWTLDGVDGVSGGLSLVIRVLDSFLGIRPFPGEQPDGTRTDEVEAIHLPLAQRNWLNYLREFDIRKVARERGEKEVSDVLEGMVSQLRVSLSSLLVVVCGVWSFVSAVFWSFLTALLARLRLHRPHTP